jgi:hypothetical protein
MVWEERGNLHRFPGYDDNRKNMTDHTMKKFTTIFLIFQIYFVHAQVGQPKLFLDKWDSDAVKKANTAEQTEYLSAEEKLVILTTNLARLDGKLFTETILTPFLEGKPKTKYTRSLIKDLSKVKDLPLLVPREDLYNIAFNHALNTGKKGSVGHEGFDRRFKPVLGKYMAVAENCAYGFEDGITNAIQLLIDESIQKLGHRKNMLSPDYNAIGVSIQYHKKYRFNCVMDFGKINESK